MVPRAAARVSSGRERICSENKPKSVEKEEPQDLALHSYSIRTTKERSPTAGLMNCKIKRRHKNLRIMLQEGAKSNKCIHVGSEKTQIWTNDVISHLKTANKIVRDDCYFKCKNSNTKLQRTCRIKETCHQQNITVIPQYLNWKILFCDLVDKDLKITVLRKLNNPQENRKKIFQWNNKKYMNKIRNLRGKIIF